jgi:hypothetical protein
VNHRSPRTVGQRRPRRDLARTVMCVGLNRHDLAQKTDPAGSECRRSSRKNAVQLTDLGGQQN